MGIIDRLIQLQSSDAFDSRRGDTRSAWPIDDYDSRRNNPRSAWPMDSPARSRQPPPAGSFDPSRTVLRADWDFRTTMPGDLSFSKGELVCLSHEVSADWWMGHRLHDPERSVGLFPSSYVHVTSPVDPRPARPSRAPYSPIPSTTCDTPASPNQGNMRSQASSLAAQAQAVPVVGGLVSAAGDRLVPRDPFSPLPPSFLRRPDPNLPYTPFEPIVIHSQLRGNDLTAGLRKSSRPFAPPPRLPWHDVDGTDWERFLHDLDITTRLGGSTELLAIGLPTVLGMGFFTGGLVQKKIEGAFKPGQVQPGLAFVERWNVEFFAPRHLDVYIAQDTQRLSGPSDPDTPSVCMIGYHSPLAGDCVGQRMGWDAQRRQRKQDKAIRKAGGSTVAAPQVNGLRLIIEPRWS